MNSNSLQLSIFIVSVIAVVTIFMMPAIPQDSAYHQFSDQRTLFNIPHALNVLSNLAFLVAGIYGLRQLPCYRDIPALKPARVLLFTGVALVAFGSGWYHLEPDNLSLLWDRLPMTIAFMALFSLVVSENIDVRLGELSLLPLIGVGMISVIYWYWTEHQGAGDLRLYALVQFLPLMLIALILIMSKPQPGKSGYWQLIGCYLGAKACEYFDAEIFALGGIISGHSLKHLISALGVVLLIRNMTMIPKEALR